MVELDKIDRTLLKILQKNNQLTNLQLAQMANLSPPTCLRRVRRLRETGVILADVCLVDPVQVGRSFFVFIEVTPDRQNEELQQAFERKMAKADEVMQCYMVSGESDFMLVVQVADMDSYHAFVRRVLADEPQRSAVASDSDGRDRNSAQLHARFGATFVVNDLVTLGARIVTGDADDPNSTDVQLSNFDDDLQVSMDLAYVQLNLGDLKIQGGKVRQPFTRTDLVWDGDVMPQGVSAIYKRALKGGGAFRANGLYHLIDEQVGGAESTMTGVQLGYDSPVHGNWQHDVSVACDDYTLGSIADGDTGDFRSNLKSPDGTYRSHFNLGDMIIAGVTWNGAGARWPLRAVADYDPLRPANVPGPA